MAARRSGAAIEWLLRPWIEAGGGRARAGRIATLAALLAGTVLPSMMLYYGLDGWWWDATIAIPTLATLGIIACDALAAFAGDKRGRAITGLPRVAFLVTGLGLGILAGYGLVLALELGPDRTAARVLADYRRTLGILIPIVVVVVIAGASLWYRAEAARLESAAAAASFAVLKGQLQPHLLFNALNALKELILDEPERAALFAQRIADLYRLILEVATAPTSTLAHEASIVEHYLAIEEVRYGERLRFRIDIPAELAGVEVPSLMLQTLAENAVRHGVARAREGGAIAISAARIAPDRVAIEVANTGARYAPASPSAAERRTAGVGLDNTRHRLALMHGAAAELHIGPDAERGTVARVVLPHEART